MKKGSYTTVIVAGLACFFIGYRMGSQSTKCLLPDDPIEAAADPPLQNTATKQTEINTEPIRTVNTNRPQPKQTISEQPKPEPKPEPKPVQLQTHTPDTKSAETTANTGRFANAALFSESGYKPTQAESYNGWNWTLAIHPDAIHDTSDPYHPYMAAIAPEWGKGLDTPKQLLSAGKCLSGKEDLIWDGTRTISNKELHMKNDQPYHFDGSDPKKVDMTKVKEIMKEDGFIVLDNVIPPDVFTACRKLIRNMLDNEWDKNTCMLQTANWNLSSSDPQSRTHGWDLDPLFAMSELPGVMSILNEIIGVDDFYVVWFQISNNRELVPWHHDQRNGNWYGRNRKFDVYKAMIYLQDHRLYPALSIVPGTQYNHRIAPAYNENNLRTGDHVYHLRTPPGSLVLHDYRNIHMNHLFPNEPVPHILVQFTFAKKGSKEAREILYNRFAHDALQKVVRAYHEGKYPGKNKGKPTNFEKKYGWLPKRTQKFSIDQ